MDVTLSFKEAQAPDNSVLQPVYESDVLLPGSGPAHVAVSLAANARDASPLFVVSVFSRGERRHYATPVLSLVQGVMAEKQGQKEAAPQRKQRGRKEEETE